MRRTALAFAVLAALCGGAAASLALPEHVAALPRTKRCTTVEGIWRALDDVGPAVMTVSLRRDAQGSYRGHARTDEWDRAYGAWPPSGCVPGVRHVTLDATMAASLQGDQLAWWIVPDTIVTVRDACTGASGSYLRGRSTGTVDLAAGTFVARFDLPGDSRTVTYYHISCSAP